MLTTLAAVISPRLLLARLAGPMARRPGRLAVIAALVCLLGAAGFRRWSVHAAPLQKFETDARQAATLALAELVSDLVKAAGAADSARTAFNGSPAAKAPDARIVDAGERAAQDAAAAVPVPPTFAQYLSGGG